MNLENKDIVTVFAPIRASEQPVISVRGEVKYPQNIILDNDQVSMKKIIDLAGGSDIPLVFVLLAIGAVPLAFIIRKVGSGKSRRKASGSSHKSSKNGSNSKKVSL